MPIKSITAAEALNQLHLGNLTPQVEIALNIPHADIPLARKELGIGKAKHVERLELTEINLALREELLLIQENCEGCDD
jgi:hypothetical protein